MKRDKLKIDIDNLKVGSQLVVKSLDACGNVIAGIYDPNEDPALGTELSTKGSRNCNTNRCPSVQPLITDVLNLPGWPKCCPGGIIGRSEDCKLKSICPDEFKDFFDFEDTKVSVDDTDQAGYLEDKIKVCPDGPLKLVKMSQGRNHQLVFCIDENEVNNKIIDLDDGPGTYSSCSESLLIGTRKNRKWLCPSDCGENSCNKSYLTYDGSKGKIEWNCAQPNYHAEIWNTAETGQLYQSTRGYYTGVSQDYDSYNIFDILPCYGFNEGGVFPEMYGEVTRPMGEKLTTKCIIIPVSGFWEIGFSAQVLANRYTHAFRYGVLIFGKQGGYIITDQKRESRTWLKDWELYGVNDSTFPIKKSQQEIGQKAKTTGLIDDMMMTGGYTTTVHLKKGVKLIMYVKAQGHKFLCDEDPQNQNCRVIAIANNPRLPNHPRATTHQMRARYKPDYIAPTCN